MRVLLGKLDAHGNCIICLHCDESEHTLLPHAHALCSEVVGEIPDGAERENLYLEGILATSGVEPCAARPHRLVTTTHGQQAIGLASNQHVRARAALLALAISARVRAPTEPIEDPDGSGCLGQLVHQASQLLVFAGVDLTSFASEPVSAICVSKKRNAPVEVKLGNGPQKLPKVSGVAPELEMSIGTRTLGMGSSQHLRILVSGDSLMFTRSNAKKKAYKTMKMEFEVALKSVVGSCDLDYCPLGGGTAKKIAEDISKKPPCDILLVGMGCNDLVTNSGTVVNSYPPKLDDDLRYLASAVRSKARLSLLLAGASSTIWGYPERWDDFVQKVHATLQREQIPLISIADATQILQRMPLAADGMHLFDAEGSKEWFAGSWSRFLASLLGNSED